MTVTDDLVVDASDTFSWTVTNTNQNLAPPVLASIGDKTLVANSTLQVDITATDADDNPLTFSLAPGDHDWAALVDHGDGSATLTLSPGSSDVGLRDLTVSVSDGIHQDAETFSVEVITGIALRGSAAAANTGTSSLVLARPTGTVNGDVLLAAITVRGTPTITPPTGWTQVRVDTRASAMRQALFVHVAAGDPVSYTWLFSLSTNAVGTIASYSGVDTANPILDHNGQTSAAAFTITAPQVTTTSANAQLVAFFGITGKTSLTPPGTMTEQREITIQKGPEKLTAALADELRPATGPTGSRVATAADSSANIGQLVALRRSTGAPPNTAPTASPVTAATDQDASVVVTLNGHDSQSCQLTFSIVSAPNHGSLGAITNNPCATGSPNTDTATLTYTPAAGYSGPDAFTYQVSDGTLSSGAATVSITVNTAPTGHIALRGSAAAANTGGSSLVLARPTGTVNGDVLLAAITVRGTPTITPPTGWTQVRVDTRASAMRQALFVHVAAGDPVSYTWLFSLSTNAVGTIASYSGVDTANPILDHNGQTSAAAFTITAPSGDHHQRQCPAGRLLRHHRQDQPDPARDHDRATRDHHPEGTREAHRRPGR